MVAKSKAAKAIQEIADLLIAAWEHDDAEGQTLVGIEVVISDYFGTPMRSNDFDQEP